MNQDDLALFTSRELIDELMRRKTFLGIVIQSDREARNNVWPEESVFKVRFNENLDTEKAGRLLAVVAEYMDRLSA